MELLHKENPRTQRLIAYLTLLIEKKAGKDEFHAYEDDLLNADPFEVNDALHVVLGASDDVESLALPVAQFIRSVGKSLQASTKPTYPDDHLLGSLYRENVQLQSFANQMQKLSLTIQKGKDTKASETGIAELKSLISDTSLLAEHFVRLQNELFPLFELSNDHHGCVKLMWALQDSCLSYRKEVLGEYTSLPQFWKTFGQFYYLVQTLLYREEQILFPVAYRSIVQEEKNPQARTVALATQLFTSPTGSLDFEVLEQIFQLLPVDIAFIDKSDRLRFYSDPPHRIFPRAPQLIGRLVQNCHPPKSVATVEKILTTFKDGSEDYAEFYLESQGRFIHISYYAVRDAAASYLGTLEVSQDATHLRSLEGEKRLL